MNPTRPILLAALACCLALSPAVRAQAPAPWAPARQYSADQVITLKDGRTITSKSSMDNGKLRTEISTNGMNMVSIIRPDLKKLYTIMPGQKMVMEMTLNPDKLQQYKAATGEDAKFELVGPEVLDATPVLKYKMTSGKDAKVFFWWIDATTKVPLKMTAEDGSFTLVWKNYKAGPQDASLFEPPADYQVIQMPGAPSGGGPGAPGP
jgi:hypothetical protein